MKKILSFLLVVVMMTALFVPVALADETYDGKTVIVYSGNLRGNVDAYAKLAAAKADFASKGATVYLVDAGNYLQGTSYANSDRGESIYNLMDKAGYDVAAMGAYEFTYGDATTGFMYHSNFFKYHTQAELYVGATGETYNQNYAGTATATIGDKEPAGFKVISSNLSGNGSYYAFDANAVLGKVGFVALTDENVAGMVQDGFLDGYTFGEAAIPECDIIVCLSNNGKTVDDATVTINAPTNGAAVMGAYVIDNETKAVSEASLPELSDSAVAAAVADVKENAKAVVGTSDVMLNGADRDNWCKETNLGDLTADALLWYANNKFDGFAKDVPVVAIQNGGNCDQFIYTGDITETDLLRALPFSPMGVGILYMTGAQLLEALEAATSPSDTYGDSICPGFAQVAGMTYNVDRSKEYDAGDAYGKFYKADSVNRVTITSVNGKDFDKNATYAVIADNFLMNGNDTYYVFTDVKSADGAKYINNGNGVKTRDIVAMYIKQELGGTVGEAYAEAQGRITDHTYSDKVTAPTCTEKGYTTHACSKCSDSYKDTYVDALGHKWDNGKVTTKASCTQAGVKTYTCTTCKNTKTESIKMLGHNYKDGVCTRCGAKDPNYKSPIMKNPFVDVKSGSFCYDPVLWAYYHAPQITAGVDKTHFAPNSDCTRAQIVTFLWRANGCPKPTSTKCAFKDVDMNAFYYDAMLWAIGEGITKGVDKTHFAPNDTCTRAQAVTFLWRADNQPKPASTKCPFKDVTKGAFYYDAMLWAVGENITNGVDKTHFAPNNTCTRGQIVTFLYRDMI